MVKAVFAEDFAPLYPAANLSEIAYKPEDNLLLARKFSTNRINHLVLPAYNEPFTQTTMELLRQVDSLVPVRVYGTPKWKEFKPTLFSSLPHISFYITSSYHYNTASIYGTSFREEYLKINRRDASEYTLQGYDLTWYVGNLLADGGFFKGISQGKPVGGFLQTEFSFAPVYKETNLLRSTILTISLFTGCFSGMANL